MIGLNGYLISVEYKKQLQNAATSHHSNANRFLESLDHFPR